MCSRLASERDPGEIQSHHLYEVLLEVLDFWRPKPLKIRGGAGEGTRTLDINLLESNDLNVLKSTGRNTINTINTLGMLALLLAGN